MNKLFTHFFIGLLSITMFSCFEEEVITDGCIISPDYLNVASKFSAEVTILENDNSTCEEKTTASETILDFFDENEGCVYEAIDFYTDTEEEAEELKAQYDEQAPLLKSLATISCQ